MLLVSSTCVCGVCVCVWGGGGGGGGVGGGVVKAGSGGIACRPTCLLVPTVLCHHKESPPLSSTPPLPASPLTITRKRFQRIYKILHQSSIILRLLPPPHLPSSSQKDKPAMGASLLFLTNLTSSISPREIPPVFCSTAVAMSVEGKIRMPW